MNSECEDDLTQHCMHAYMDNIIMCSSSFIEQKNGMHYFSACQSSLNDFL